MHKHKQTAFEMLLKYLWFITKLLVLMKHLCLTGIIGSMLLLTKIYKSEENYMANKQYISKDQLQSIITDGKLEISSAILEEGGNTREDFALSNEFSTVGLKLDEKATLLPTYPELVGKVSSKTSSENTITATLNLTPVLGTQTPLFT